MEIKELDELIKKTEQDLIKLKQERQKFDDVESLEAGVSGIYVEIKSDAKEYDITYFYNSHILRKMSKDLTPRVPCLFDISGVTFGNGFPELSRKTSKRNIVKLNQTSLNKLHNFLIELAVNQFPEDED